MIVNESFKIDGVHIGLKLGVHRNSRMSKHNQFTRWKLLLCQECHCAPGFCRGPAFPVVAKAPDKSYEETAGLRKIGTMTCKICDGDLALRCLLPLRVANRLFLQILLAASDDLWAASPAIITPLAFRRLPQFLGRDEMTNAAILYCFPRERRSATTFVKSRESRARRIAAQTGAVQSVISSFHCKSEPGGLS